MSGVCGFGLLPARGEKVPAGRMRGMVLTRHADPLPHLTSPPLRSAILSPRGEEVTPAFCSPRSFAPTLPLKGRVDFLQRCSFLFLLSSPRRAIALNRLSLTSGGPCARYDEGRV